ncbi:hypothetical protein EON64_06455 [archaeon]|nr:MAG: hypothetical protein EON64_06455 [archaeon]
MMTTVQPQDIYSGDDTDKNTPYHTMIVDDILRVLSTNVNVGLSEAEAEQRLQKYGQNVLPSAPQKSAWERLWEQVNSTITYVLVVGAALSFGFEHYADGIVIIVVVIVNVSIGYYMEGKAASTTQKLKSMMSPTALTRRDGERRIVQATDLVKGDVFFLQAGDVVPADGRILSYSDLSISEAALTGESHSVLKDASELQDAEIPLAERTCIAFAGTQVIKGSATCVVTNTGADCEIGKISSLLKDVKPEKTPLVVKLERFGTYLSILIIVFSLGALFAALYRGRYAIDDAFSFAVGVAVAAIPEGLPSVMTIIFAVGVRFMAKQGAIVKSLPAVETLGSVSVICSDKTGTLTQNCMTVKAVCTNSTLYEVSILQHLVCLDC